MATCKFNPEGGRLGSTVFKLDEGIFRWISFCLFLLIIMDLVRVRFSYHRDLD